MNIIILIQLLAGIGIINTIYLSYHSFTKTPVYCLGFPDAWCKAVQQSKYSKTLGIPNPYLGLVMYCALLIFTFLFNAEVISFWPIAIVVYMGFAFSMYFTFIQAAVIKAFCTWCVISALDFIVLFIAVISYQLLY